MCFYRLYIICEVLPFFQGPLLGIIFYRVKLGNGCALKLEKATKASFNDFFSCHLSPNVPHGCKVTPRTLSLFDTSDFTRGVYLKHQINYDADI